MTTFYCNIYYCIVNVQKETKKIIHLLLTVVTRTHIDRTLWQKCILLHSSYPLSIRKPHQRSFFISVVVPFLISFFSIFTPHPKPPHLVEPLLDISNPYVYSHSWCMLIYKIICIYIYIIFVFDSTLKILHNKNIQFLKKKKNQILNSIVKIHIIVHDYYFQSTQLGTHTHTRTETYNSSIQTFQKQW